jgi:hypothetical protein
MDANAVDDEEVHEVGLEYPGSIPIGKRCVVQDPVDDDMTEKPRRHCHDGLGEAIYDR